ncbi:MAG: tetratricopeptide repeat protein, partial [Proteobacteria bacterium]|nr:tetratricopeptide repeat protein [Pseudomonadota bacterium]
ALDLAVRHHGAGELSQAEAIYQKILTADPNQPVAMHLLGVIANQTGNNDIAIELITKALAIKPDYAEAHNNLGNAFLDLGRLEDAVASYHKALALEPDFANAHNNLGNALQDLGRLEDAVVSYHKALAINPDYAEAHNNLGNAFTKLGRPDEAAASHNKAITLKPDYAEAHNNLGNALKSLGRLDEAIASYHKALAIKPDFSGAGRNLLFVLLDVPGLSPDELFTEHLRISDIHSRDIARPAEDLTNDPAPERRLRVGYLSSDFWNQSVGSVLLPLLSSHDRAEFEVFCYADVPRPDAMTERFQSCVDHWRPITGKPDSEVAGMMRTDAIDVLVCVAGRFGGNRPLVCAHRAAPVQVSFHDGATSGLKEMDYWLTDDFLHPPGTKERFTEELYRLPVFYQWPPIGEAPTVEALPADRAGFVTFGSFNNPVKVNEEVISLWAEVLKSVPGSRLVLKYLSWYDQEPIRHRVLEGLEASGIERERVTFLALRDTFAEHLGSIGEVDIGLDPFPFNGATTTFQSLWMGVPVVSLAGETFISRAAGSILHHVGLEDLAVDTPEAYVACAGDLAGDLGRLRTLRKTLRERLATSPICNAPDHTRSVEDAYREMWRKWCALPKNIR